METPAGDTPRPRRTSTLQDVRTIVDDHYAMLAQANY
jgi:hypothetical protein